MVESVSYTASSPVTSADDQGRKFKQQRKTTRRLNSVSSRRNWQCDMGPTGYPCSHSPLSVNHLDTPLPGSYTGLTYPDHCCAFSPFPYQFLPSVRLPLSTLCFPASAAILRGERLEGGIAYDKQILLFSVGRIKHVPTSIATDEPASSDSVQTKRG